MDVSTVAGTSMWAVVGRVFAAVDHESDDPRRLARAPLPRSVGWFGVGRASEAIALGSESMRRNPPVLRAALATPRD